MESDDGKSFVYLSTPRELIDGTCSIVEDIRSDRDISCDLPIWYILQKPHRWISIFNETIMKGQTDGVISPLEWYPHLAAFLLNRLVRSQYGTRNPEFEGK